LVHPKQVKLHHRARSKPSVGITYAVGKAERNSASDAARQRLQMPATIRPQVTLEGPPLGKANDMLAPAAVHVFRMANARPSIGKNEKLRLSSCLIPIPAKAASSRKILLLRCWAAASDLVLGLRSALMVSCRSTCSFDFRSIDNNERRQRKREELQKTCRPACLIEFQSSGLWEILAGCLNGSRRPDTNLDPGIVISILSTGTGSQIGAGGGLPPCQTRWAADDSDLSHRLSCQV